MNKFVLSILAGIIIGGLLSFLFMDYQNQGYEITDYHGIESFKVNELDFNFLFNATIIVVILSVLIFISWTLVEKNYRGWIHSSTSALFTAASAWMTVVSKSGTCESTGFTSNPISVHPNIIPSAPLSIKFRMTCP